MKSRWIRFIVATLPGMIAASMLFGTCAVAQTSPYLVNGAPTANATVVTESGASDTVTTSGGSFDPASAFSDTGGNTSVTVGGATTIVVTSGHNAISLSSGSVDNAGSVTAPSGETAVVFTSSPATVTNESGATLLGGNDGVALEAGGTVTNSGTITGTNTDGVLVLHASATVTNNAGGSIMGSENGLDLEDGATVTNDGTVQGSSTGILVLSQTGMVTNGAAGSISGGSQDGISFNHGGTLVNAGSVTGSYVGVLVTSGVGQVTNQAGGTISANYAVNLNLGGTVTNSGSIGGSGSTLGVLITDGTGTVTNNAGGTIFGTGSGVSEVKGGTVINAGQITATSSNLYEGIAINISGGLGTVQNLAGGIISSERDPVALAVGGSLTNAGTITSEHEYAVFGATSVFNSGTITSLEGTQNSPDRAYNAIFLHGTFTNVGGTVSAPGLYYAVQFTSGNNTANIGNLSHFNGDLDRDLYGGGFSNEVLNFNFLGGTIGTPQGTPAYGSLTAQGETYTYQAFTAVNVTGHSLASLGGTPNESTIGGALDRAIDKAGVTGINPPNLVTLDSTLTHLYGNSNAAAVANALSELSPEAFASFASSTAFNNASFETEAMDSYLAGLRQGPDGSFAGGAGGIDSRGLTLNDRDGDPALSAVQSRLLAWNPAPFAGVMSDVADPLLGGVEMKDEKAASAPVAAASNPWDVFVRGNVILAQGFSGQDVPHFDDNTESVTLGADYRLTPNFLLGLTAGYAHTDVTLDDQGSSATVDSYSPGLYASYADHGWYANLAGDYLHNAYTQDRRIAFLGQTASSAPEGDEGVAKLDGGYDFQRGALTFGPLAGLQYTHLSVDGYEETGSIADLSVNESEADSLRSELGGSVRYAFHQGGVTFTPHLDASWQHEFLDRSRGITSQFGVGGGSFAVRTASPSRDSALVDAGVTADLNRTVNIFADYIAQAGQDDYFGQSVQAGVKIGF